MSGVVAILGYHKIGDPPPDGWSTWNYVDVETFVAQLEVVRESEFEVIDHASLIEALVGAAELPEHSLLLTFDDGYRSTLTEATPQLEAFGFPGAVFVPTDHVGSTNVWDQGNEPSEPLCDWSELAELDARGVSVQSHAASHRTFGSLGVDELRDEAVRSRAILERELGKAVTSLAYPYGDAGGAATRGVLADTGYLGAFGYGGGAQRLPCGNPFELTRVPVGPDTDLAEQLRRARALCPEESP